MKPLLMGSMMLAVTFLAPGAQDPPRSDAVLLTGAKLLEADGERWLDGKEVLIVGGRIARIAPAGTSDAEGARRVDLRGLYLAPGLIDLHSHLLLHPYDETPWDDQVLKESLETRTVRAVAAALATLQAGFTTVRELGTEGAGFADVALRDAIASGIVPGPRVFASTRAIVATGCYGPSGFDPRWAIPKAAQEADGEDGVRKAVREQAAAGADWIKVYADYRRVKGAPPTPTFSQEELNAIVSEAHSAGLPVAAHAVTNEGILRAVRAGVETIEHGTQASDEILTLMRERGVTLCPTLSASEAMARYGGWRPGQPEPPSLQQSKEMFARALRSKVIVACGSDAGVFAHGDNAREIELMAAYGMTPAGALRAATTIAAKTLQRATDLGRIAEGFAADLIALPGDPLKDVSVLRRPVVVVKDGRVVVDRRSGGGG